MYLLSLKTCFNVFYLQVNVFKIYVTNWRKNIGAGNVKLS